METFVTCVNPQKGPGPRMSAAPRFKRLRDALIPQALQDLVLRLSAFLRSELMALLMPLELK